MKKFTSSFAAIIFALFLLTSCETAEQKAEKAATEKAAADKAAADKDATKK